MDERGDSTSAFEQLRERFGDESESASADDSDEPAWKRYTSLLQIALVVGAAFGGTIVSVASSAIDRTTTIARASGPALAETLWPILLGITALAVVICLVVVGLSVRNV
ncbi:hypothetical protein C448_11601 [Halococcus morrhuae DSM 1307]|uniref:Uncharacterized protein n=1 Tax=Halococcus morrhuae DSM 1307 TaxID=931277 RepID=M0MA00_HALMO|nr:hypothetical protein [Halococcus morrhuae]EMA42173.1 hypothetical protein C448_11601 [Halococcus morrhuae DSM 1307]